MRGDSVRDFYAKSFALLGLSVLAGTGALVDYWPSGIETPTVPPVLGRPALLAALPVPEFGSVDVAPVAPRAPASLAREADRRPLPQLVPADVSVLVALAAARPLAARGFQTMAVTPAVGVDAMELPLAPMLLASATTPERMSAPVGLADDDSMFTGALKGAGHSIMKGSAHATALVGGAVRSLAGGLAGAVRKALPN